MSTASAEPPSSPEATGLSNPIPMAAVATSHVNQVDPHSPPQPPLAFSPNPDISNPSSPPPILQLDTAPQSKPHPADLISAEHPDAGHSPPASPTESSTEQHHAHSFSQAFDDDDQSAASFPTAEGGAQHHGHGRGADVASSILSASENGVTLGHGSEDHGGGHVDSPRMNGRRRSGSAFGDSQALVESDAEGEEQHEQEEHDGEGEEAGDQVEALGPLSYTNANNNFIDSSSPPSTTPRKSHGRSQSMASPSTSRPPSSSSSPRQPPSTSSSNERPSSATRDGTSADRDRERERRGERRDREREREREAAAAHGQSGREKEGRSGEKEREKEKESTRSRRVLGEWTMSKTLGAGSMGKVKLGISGITGEKVAIKIIPRYTSTAAANRPPPKPSSKDGAPPSAEEKEYKPPTASFLAKAAAKDQSKEVRTMREGSLSLLLHHPYVCGMKSMMLYPNHYYMIFEYVNGGQMLDYIISHGRLRERSARKFARQIGSALEYCHANSIVHRDLKIENILISKTGNIKIIDFGLSNLYSPTSHLSTFCGSLYFAAPELLNAKPYTGPEVDVWSFGIVLYVLVCGKVPFDDQSMPALHAKIKRGQVEYPGWLSAECKHLLSRMLVTTPSSRATLSEVLAHPWIVKGFSGPPASHLPPRIPLRADDLDRDIIKGMVGFELGSDGEVYEKLRDVLVSDGYRQAVRSWEGRKAAGLGGAGEKEEGRESDKERPATRVDGKDMKGLGRSPTNKRFSGLGFYGKKLAGGLNAAFNAGGSGGGRSSDDSDGGGGHGPLNGHHGVGGGRVDSLDPTRGFHPLISLYFLVKEKIEREKIWGPGVFASSTLSLTGPPPPPAPAMAYQAGSGTVPVPPPSAASGIKPPPSALSATAPKDVSAPPIASPLIPMTPQPRQRATGEEYPQHPSTAPQGSRGDDYRFASNSASKRSSFHPASSAPNTPVLTSQFAQRPRSSYEPASPTPQRTSHIIDRTGSGVGSHSQQQEPSSSLAAPDDVPLSSSPSGFARRFGSLLGRSSSTNADFKPGHRQRASIAGTSHRASTKTPASALPQVTETSIRASGSDVPLPSPPEGQAVHRSSTVGELSPNRHQRGVSMGAESLGRATVGAAGGASERRRLVSMGEATKPLARPRTSGNVQTMFDEVEEELTDSAAVGGGAPWSTIQDRHHQDDPPHPHLQQDVGFIGRTASASGAGSEQAKPVWLKGLFSVTTTSTKPAATIRADLIRVLDRLGVQHRDVKSGFECAHVPSIDLSSVGAGKKDPGGKGTIRRRASNLLLSSSGGSRKDKETGAHADDSSTSLGNAQGGGAPPHGASSTSFDPTSPTFDSSSQAQGSPNQHQPAKFSSSTAEGSNVSSELIVRFEIFIVRMPLLPGISGLQFRRIGGNAWQYQMLARRVLAELKL